MDSCMLSLRFIQAETTVENCARWPTAFVHVFVNDATICSEPNRLFPKDAVRGNFKRFFSLDKANRNGQVEWSEWLKDFEKNVAAKYEGKSKIQTRVHLTINFWYPF